MSQSPHILVVDDDEEICSLVREYLEDEGYRVSTAPDGAAMRAVLAHEPVDLIFLDLRLPGEDGLSLAKEVLHHHDVGVIIISGKDDVVDRVAGLELGADDYITKPFHLRELLARLRTVLRRRSAAPLPAAFDEGARPALRFAGWKLERDARRLVSPGGESVELTSTEFDLLLAFLDHPDRVLSRDQLLDMVHNRGAALFDRSIDVQVGRLRRKIEANPKRPALIKTVRGAGYKIAVPVERG